MGIIQRVLAFLKVFFASRRDPRWIGASPTLMSRPICPLEGEKVVVKAYMDGRTENTRCA
jgi:hypothetical protein